MGGKARGYWPAIRLLIWQQPPAGADWSFKPEAAMHDTNSPIPSNNFSASTVNTATQGPRPAARPADAMAALHALLADPALEVRRTGVASGTVIFEPTAPARTVYFILRGQVRLYQEDEQGASRLCEIL